MSGESPPVAMVTGGAGGLGRAIVERLRSDGFRVAAADLSTTTGVGTASTSVLSTTAEAGTASTGALSTTTGAGEEMAVLVDVTDPASAEAMCAQVHDRWGRIDVLVNNAGIAGPTLPVTEYPPEAWSQVINVNLGGVFHCTRACLPYMIARGYGRIVNMASIAGKDGNPQMSAYSAAKAGVIAFTKSVAKEVARTGVLVNCLVPGVIDAGLTDRAPEGERQLFLSRIPMGRMGRPAEVAELVSWLASERCSFSTGAAFDLSGGRAVY